MKILFDWRNIVITNHPFGIEWDWGFSYDNMFLAYKHFVTIFHPFGHTNFMVKRPEYWDNWANRSIEAGQVYEE